MVFFASHWSKLDSNSVHGNRALIDNDETGGGGGGDEMFRSKKKKSASGARKRKDIDADYGDEAAADVVLTGGATGEQQEQTTSEGDGDAVMRDDAIGDGNGRQETAGDGERGPGGDDDEVDEDALLARMRDRNAKRGKLKSAMTFSSKASSSTNKSANDAAIHMQSNAFGSLSFADVEAHKTSGSSPTKNRNKRQSRIKIRPNLLEEGEEQIEAQMRGSGDEEGEDFIPLNAKLMQSRKKRNRVTFGVHSSSPKLSKMTEVDEPIDSGDGGEDDEDDPSRKWEEELMRRGGHHAPLTEMSRGNSADGRGSKKTYPTRKKVPNGSLSDVLTKLQRSFDAATFENDRAARELVHIDAEMLLIEESTRKQRQELLTSSEEFEYFQVMEDYVKGLSFCLREKVREIDANEKEIANMRVINIRSIREAEVKHAREIANKLVETGAIADADIRGLRILDAADGNTVLPVIFSSGLSNEVTEKLKRGFVDRTPAIQQEDSTFDVFADAVDDMNSIQHVYGRFQEWRSKFPEIYKNCYCDIALEKLYAPYVRAELLFWDPLSVAKPTGTGKAWGFESFEWFKILRQHVRAPQSSSVEFNGSFEVDDGPVVAQIRDVVLAKALDAITLYFDPFSALHTRSICVLLEELAKYDGYTQHCAHALTGLVMAVTSQFTSESKLIPLIAVRENRQRTDGATSYDFAAYQIGRFNALLDNLLTFFVALPRDATAGSSQTTGFRCVMQVLHQLLAFLSHCQRVQKMLLVSQAMQTVTQLTASPYLQQLLASSSQEQELKHILTLFAPFVAI